MGSDGLDLPWVWVWVCRCGLWGSLVAIFILFVVLMVGEGGVLQIFSVGGWLVDLVVCVCGEWWSGGRVCCFGFVVGGVY